jgi:hypothetical protein
MTTSVDVLPDLLSLDVTAGLVKQGRRARWNPGATEGDAPTYTVAVLDASNTTPIVITVAAGSIGQIAPREGRILHVVIAGVTGNTAANKLSVKEQRNEAWVAIVTSEEDDAQVTLALYDLDVSTGGLVASVGNGAYAGGGTVSKAMLDGRILVGKEYVTENSFAPKIVMVPLRTTYGPRDVTSSFTAAAIADEELDRERTARSVATTVWWYEVHVWGIAPPGTVELGKRSFGYAEALHHQVISSAHARCKGCYELGSGTWIDQVDGAPQRIKGGHELVFQLGLSAPVPDEALELSPDEMTVDAVLSLDIGDGSPEEA